MLRRNILAEDMEMDILLRLPVKSLLRFKCVSKSWCTRFQNQLFITNHYLKQTSLHNTNNYANVSVLVHRQNAHLPPSQDPPCFSLLDQTLNIKENIHLPYPMDFSFFHQRIMGPCNGLLCWWNLAQITLWNPSTREFKYLPKSHIQRPPITKFTIIKNIGFGFDSKTNDYKVICILDNHYDNKIIQQVDLYTRSTDSWREIQTPVVDLPYETPHMNTYINGVFHWLSWGSSGPQCIIAFDMADELFSMLPLPNLCFSYNCWDLGVLNGSLAIFNYPNPSLEIKMNFDIWVMKEYGVTESWTKLLTIGPIFGSYMPLGFWKNGRLFLQNIADKKLVLYDPNNQEIEELQVHSHSVAQMMRVVTYVESLVPINGRREHEDEHFIRLPTQMGDA